MRKSLLAWSARLALVAVLALTITHGMDAHAAILATLDQFEAVDCGVDRAVKIGIDRIHVEAPEVAATTPDAETRIAPVESRADASVDRARVEVTNALRAAHPIGVESEAEPVATIEFDLRARLAFIERTSRKAVSAHLRSTNPEGVSRIHRVSAHS